MKFSPVEFAPPEPARVVLDNGMVVYLLEDHELPLVNLSATMRTGGWLEPADKVGLAALTGRGHANRRRRGQDRRANRRGTRAICDRYQHVDGTAVRLGFTGRPEQRFWTAGFESLRRALRQPAFEAARVELAKLQTIEGIRRRQDSPGSIVGREFLKQLYGPEHPSARESTIESISGITRDDLVEFHQRTVHPNGIILGVTGDFKQAEMLALLRRRLATGRKEMCRNLKSPTRGRSRRAFDRPVRQ